MISGWLREPHSSDNTVQEIISQLIGIGGSRSVGFGKHRVTSIPDAIAKVLADEFGYMITSKEGAGNNNGANNDSHETNLSDNGEDPIISIKEPEKSAFSNTDVCPECGNCTLVQEEGCAKCYSCGYSHC